ncbi:DNA polymerase [Lactobacillus phage phiJL-1]|uniref:DNA polymerase n=1 Tax=Lactobacillus phage phiJL-1 TaxID=2892345 RepID=Q597T0_9CAUD|nr:DNA polymerase [Lactobacillus phage phiJL-1]AAP74541.1 putative DNA polymerase [Lactobacillus phage phiJL-1]
MSNRAQRVLDALMDYDADNRFDYPILTIIKFFDNKNITSVDIDYDNLTVNEEKQVIQAFLEFAY